MDASILAGKRVPITGGAGGVGRSLAGLMANSGAKGLITDRNEVDLRSVVEAIDGRSPRSWPIFRPAPG